MLMDMLTDPTPLLTGKVHRAIEPLHSMAYFAPETEQKLTLTGLRPGRMCYLAARSAPMGRVTAPVTTATFFNFNPTLVADNIPAAWGLADPDSVVIARLSAVDLALRRLFGELAVDCPEVVEAARLTSIAARDLDPAGRPLFAAHAGLAWPDQPHLVLWHAVTLLREFRGDGHLAVLLAAGLSGIDAIITHTATGRGFTEAAAKRLRGWSDNQWSEAVEGLCSAGVLGPEGLTERGVALRAQIESDTDRLAAMPWLRLGEQDTTRLAELGAFLSTRIRLNGAFPDGIFAAGR